MIKEILIILVLLAPAVSFQTSDCYEIKIFGYTGYSCHEKIGLWHSFYDPGAYQQINTFYANGSITRTLTVLK